MRFERAWTFKMACFGRYLSKIRFIIFLIEGGYGETTLNFFSIEYIIKEIVTNDQIF